MGYFEDLQKLKSGQIDKIGPDKPKYRIPQQSEKKKNKLKAEKPETELLEQWFEDREKEQTGFCYECGEPSTKGNPEYWKFSICHILPKALFPSVKTHPLNKIEWCYFNKSHHTNADNNGFEWVKVNMPKSWNFIVSRFKILYPLLTSIEMAKVPNVLLQELDA